MPVTRRTLPRDLACTIGSSYVTPSFALRSKAGRGIANASGSSYASGLWQHIVTTSTYDVIDSETLSVVGTWSSVHTLDHPGDPVVYNSIDVYFTEEVEDDGPLSEGTELAFDSLEITQTRSGAVSLSQITAFAESTMSTEWVSYLTASSIAPGAAITGVSSIWISPAESRVEILESQWTPQAFPDESFSVSEFPDGFELEFGFTVKTIDLDLETSSDATGAYGMAWNGSEFRNDDPEDPQGAEGWLDFPAPPATGINYDLSVFSVSLDVWPMLR